jgi:3-oxoadipate enol-lactonase
VIRESVATLPGLPRGFDIDLPGRGRIFVRDAPGPAGAPTLLLLHGWTATADLNWFTCFDALSAHFRVVACDLRGHGRGIRSSSAFTLEDCADDAAAVADVLGVPTFIPVGYSMGGAVAQLLWQRHEFRVRGAVLCATAGYFLASREERLTFLGLSGLAAASRLTPAQTRDWISDQLYLQRKLTGFEGWAAQQISSHDWRRVLEAGRAIGSFDSRPWLGAFAAPSAVVVTTADTTVSPVRQHELAATLRDAEVFEVDAEHSAVYAARERFVPRLVEACRSVHRRSTGTA